MRPEESVWGCALSSLGRPCVAQRVCPIAKCDCKSSVATFSASASTRPTARVTTSFAGCDRSSSKASPAESYPRYSNFRSPPSTTCAASLGPMYPTIPHIWCSFSGEDHVGRPINFEQLCPLIRSSGLDQGSSEVNTFGQGNKIGIVCTNQGYRYVVGAIFLLWSCR